jgi:hypothetical protein
MVSKFPSTPEELKARLTTGTRELFETSLWLSTLIRDISSSFATGARAEVFWAQNGEKIKEIIALFLNTYSNPVF